MTRGQGRLFLGRPSCWLAAAASALLAASPLAQAVAGPMEDAAADMHAGRYAAAAKRLRPLAEQGDPAAELRLGILYAIGLGVTKDAALGQEWMSKAESAGYVPAVIIQVSKCVIEFEKSPDICARAVKELQVGADHGDRQAETQLGILYLLGKAGVAKDPQQGLHWLGQAAEQGDTQAAWQLSLAYMSGLWGVTVDREQADRWERKAADEGDLPAQDGLAMKYQLGLGVAKDPAQAVNWYRRAAEKGDQMAEGALAKMYDEGDGVQKDPAEAFAWNRKLAEQGDMDAMARVGSAYALGKGVKRDAVEAFAWMDLAIQQARDADRTPSEWQLTRDAIAADLSAPERAKAKRRARELAARLSAEPDPAKAAFGALIATAGR